MKYLSKLGVVASIVCLSLLVSGCGSKEYTCTKVETSNNMETTTKMEIKKNGVNTNVSIVITSDTEEKAKSVEKSLTETKLYSTVKRDGKKVIAEYTKFFEGQTSSNDKKELEKDGYTCK